MRIYYSTNDVEFEYPNPLIFAFNSQYLVVKNENLVSINVTIQGGGKTFTDNRDAIDGYVRFDISYYLRLLFDITHFNQTTGRNVTVKIKALNINGMLAEFTFTSYVIFGVMNIGDVFNKSRKIKVFKNLPFTFSVYTENGTVQKQKVDNGAWIYDGIQNQELAHKTLNQISVAQNEIIYQFYKENGNTFDYTFDYTFTGTDYLIIKCEICDCTQGIYLRWLDRHGFYNYYLFDELTQTLKHENNGEKTGIEFLSGQYYSKTSNYIDGVFQQNKKAEREIALQVPFADKETREQLETIFTSPFVQMYLGEIDGNKDNWVSVQVTTGNYETGKQHLQDFDLKIILPETITQEL